jgi:hypothetical protein
MMKIITTVLGALLCLTTVVGFVNHDFMRMDLSPLHDGLLLVLGAVALYFGINGTEFQSRYTNRTLGVLFTLLGALTLFASKGVATAGGVSIVADHVLKLIPNHLEYTTADGIRDLIVGIVGLVAGFMPRETEIAIDMKATQNKVPTAR